MTELNPNDIIKLTLKNKETITGIIISITDAKLVLNIPPDKEHTIEIVDSKLVDVISISRLFKAKGYIDTHGYKIGNVLSITFDDQNQVNATIVEIEYDIMSVDVNGEMLYIDFNYKQTLPDGIIKLTLAEAENEVFQFEYVMLDKSKRRYMLDQQLADLLQTMTYTKTPMATLIVQRYKELMMEFPEGVVLTPNQSNLKWVYPVISEKIKLFTFLSQNEKFKSDMANILVSYVKKTLTNTDKTLPVIDETLSKLLRPLNRAYTPSALKQYILKKSKVLTYVKNKGSKVEDQNWKEKQRNWVSYVFDDKVSPDGFVRLPSTSISFSKLYLPETNIVDKINLNFISKYNFLNFKCNESFANNVPEKPFFSLTNAFVPTVKSLISTQFSMYEFIKQLEPYHIYSNHIEYKSITSLATKIAKNIENYKSTLFKSDPIPSTVIHVDEHYNKIYTSTSELYNWALIQDYGDVFIASNLKSAMMPKELPLPKQEIQVFKLNPNEPECELKDNCDTKGAEKLKQHLLTVHNTNLVEPRDTLTISLLKKKIKLANIKLLKYNNKLIQFLKSDPPIVSPYQDKFDRIMQKKMSERYVTLLLFIDEYTISSDSAWLLCKTNKSKLVPIFLQTLAKLYVLSDKTEYYNHVKYICKPDCIDNGFYIDRASGYPIAPLESAVSYDEEIRSSVLRVDVEHQTTTYTNPQVILSKWLSLLSKHLDISISQEQNIHIVKNVYNITSNYKIQTQSPIIMLTLLVYVVYTLKDTFNMCTIRTIQTCIDYLIKKWVDIPLAHLFDKTKYPSFNLEKTIPKILNLISIKKVEVAVMAPYNWTWTTFMPSPYSTDPVMIKINTEISKQTPIHLSENGIPKKINTVIVDLGLDKPPYVNHKLYSAYASKRELEQIPVIEFNYKMKPIIIPFNFNHDDEYEYLFDESKIMGIRELEEDLRQEDIYLDWNETNIPCIVNFIYSMIHFYTKLSPEQLKLIQQDIIPKSNVDLISPSHKQNIDTFINKYYPDSIRNGVFEDLLQDADINEILTELKQPLNHPHLLRILYYYILFIFDKIFKFDKTDSVAQKHVVNFFIERFKIDMVIPNYTLQQISDKISIAKSKERELIKHRLNDKDKEGKRMHSILDKFGLNEELNLQRLRTHNKEAKELRQAQVEQDNDNDNGNDGNEFI